MSGRHRQRDARRRRGWHVEMRGAEAVLVGHGLIAIFGAQGELSVNKPLTADKAMALADAYMHHMAIPVVPWTPFNPDGTLSAEVCEQFRPIGAMTDDGLTHRK